MKTYLTDIIPKIKRFSRKLDNLTLLTNQHWVAIDDIDNLKSVYIFRDNNDLLISFNGKIEKGTWEYLDSNSLLIERGNNSYLLRHGFFDENIIALKLDGNNEHVFFVNETKFNSEINSIKSINNFLHEKYLNSNSVTKYLLDNKDQLAEGFNLKYKIIKEDKKWGLFNGRHTEFHLIFEEIDSLKGKLIFITSSKEYFHITKDDTLYFNDFIECANSLGKSLIEEKYE